MSMKIATNLSAQKTLGELNKNTVIAGKSLEKISVGEKVHSAQDDAAAWSISERMLAQMKSLDQSTENVQNGSALLKIAEGGVENIIAELQNLRELAINAATDTNSDEDRAILQKRFEQSMANINDIATTTNYNGKNLIDGTFGGFSVRTFTEEVITSTTEIITDTSSGISQLTAFTI